MNSNLSTPRAIILGSLIIATAILVVGFVGTVERTPRVPQVAQVGAAGGDNASENVAKVTKDDHIRGDLDAPIKIVEYSDIDCPFCQRVHPTLEQVVGTYGDDVAWVYRHFPLESLHPKARLKAEASECVARLGGNDAFWGFIDGLIEDGPTRDNSDIEGLPARAAQFGISQADFSSCLSDSKTKRLVADDIENGLESGVQGTPHTIIIAPNGDTFPISGAQPFSSFQAIIDGILNS